MTLVEVACARVLERVEQKMISIRGAIEDYLKQDPSVKPVRDVMLALCLGTVRNYVLLDHLILHACGIDMSKLDLFTRYLLRVLAYELRFRECDLDRVRRALRHCRRVSITAEALAKVRDVSISDIVRELDVEHRLHVLYSIPLWLVKYLADKLGLDETEQLLRAFNEKAPMYIRVNTRRISRSELAQRLARRGVEVELDEELDDLILVKKLNVNLESLPEYREGLFYIQDKASVMVGHVLKKCVPELKLVLDACSAPGGKAMHLQELTQCYVVGTDVSYRRLETEHSLVKRYGYTNIDTVCANMLRPPIRARFFDVLLVDPDCSSLGKLAHSPEVRLWIRRHHVLDYAKHQYKLLRSLVSSFRDRFRYILYSTCTITFEENEENVRKVCEEFNLEVVDLSELFPRYANSFLPGTLRMLPHKHNTSGYFIALLRPVKTSSA